MSAFQDRLPPLVRKAGCATKSRHALRQPCIPASAPSAVALHVSSACSRQGCSIQAATRGSWRGRAGTLTTTRKAHISGLVSGLLAAGLGQEPDLAPAGAAARLQACTTRALQDAAAQPDSAAFSDRLVDLDLHPFSVMLGTAYHGLRLPGLVCSAACLRTGYQPGTS